MKGHFKKPHDVANRALVLVHKADAHVSVHYRLFCDDEPEERVFWEAQSNALKTIANTIYERYIQPKNQSE